MMNFVEFSATRTQEEDSWEGDLLTNRLDEPDDNKIAVPYII